MIKIENAALYDKQYHCPVCNSSFKSKKIRSRAIRIEKIENDFFTIYKNPELNPLLYEVIVCKECAFSYTDQFNLVIRNDLKEKFKSTVTSNWKQQQFNGERTYEDAIATYKLSILSSKVIDQPSVIIGGLCLKLSWIYRILGVVKEEERFIHNALINYKQSYINGDYRYSKMSELKLMFLLGELYRKIKDYESAVTFFSKAIQHKERHLEPSIEEKAREQWYLTRENLKETEKYS